MLFVWNYGGDTRPGNTVSRACVCVCVFVSFVLGNTFRYEVGAPGEARGRKGKRLVGAAEQRAIQGGEDGLNKPQPFSILSWIHTHSTCWGGRVAGEKYVTSHCSKDKQDLGRGIIGGGGRGGVSGKPCRKVNMRARFNGEFKKT